MQRTLRVRRGSTVVFETDLPSGADVSFDRVESTDDAVGPTGNGEDANGKPIKDSETVEHIVINISVPVADRTVPLNVRAADLQEQQVRESTAKSTRRKSSAKKTTRKSTAKRSRAKRSAA